MKKFDALSASIFLAVTVSFASAQTFPKSVQKSAAANSAPPGTVNQNAAPQSLADRRAALNGLLAEIWQDRLAHHPEFASAIGDKRYDDQLTDYSVAAYNVSLDRGREFLVRLGGIDTTGMTDQEVASKNRVVQQLVDQQQEAESKPWETPLTLFDGIQITLPELVPMLSFDTAKDYDDYTVRLEKIPAAFQQVTNNAMSGIDDGRVPPKVVLDKIFAQVNGIATQKPEEAPFAQPLKKLPAAISAADQARIRTEVLDAIRTKVQPAYAQLGRFLTKTYIPASSNQQGVWLPRR